ncbi:MAG TPA: hypothetical protein VG942_14465 [Hyphomonadaceae bacterium]|nr:hypothetical protein [Hyphomonadaceae bacterium]
MKTSVSLGKRIAVVGLMLMAGGCELLKHVRIESDDHSPFAQERSAVVPSDSKIGLEFRVPLTGGQPDDGK